ncbi:hypothetical protein GCM10022222_41340 [Amycolatopsis ultiminotia]|uniref:Secreted protein n=1 Tax=Amycolatopsis ultiminotia TaxID=543629 RepID=A0ABP6WLG8_9PSEU
MNEWLLSALSVVVVGGYGLWYLRSYRKRRDKYAAAAAEQGWAYTQRDRDLLGRCHGYPFLEGRRPRAWHAITGQDGRREFLSFEYSDVIGGTTSDDAGRAERYFTQVFALKVPDGTRSLAVQPRGVLGKLGGGLGFRGGTIGDPDFDRRWTVDGSPGDVTPAVRDWLARHRRPFRRTAGELWIWVDGRMDVGRIAPALGDLHELADALGKRLPPPSPG